MPWLEGVCHWGGLCDFKVMHHPSVLSLLGVCSSRCKPSVSCPYCHAFVLLSWALEPSTQINPFSKSPLSRCLPEQQQKTQYRTVLLMEKPETEFRLSIKGLLTMPWDWGNTSIRFHALKRKIFHTIFVSRRELTETTVSL